jgi:nicotinamidase-related amidase
LNLASLIKERKAALLVYDAQVGIFNQVPHAQSEIANAKRVLDGARQAGLPIFFSQHVSLPRKLMGKFQVRQAMAWQRTNDPDSVQPWFLPGSDAASIHPSFAPLPDEMIVQKIGMSAFQGTFLEVVLRDLGLEAFLIVGAAIEVGIEPTIRHAADLGLVPIFVSDACAPGHLEAAARSVEAIRFAGDAIVTETEAIVATLRG